MILTITLSKIVVDKDEAETLVQTVRNFIASQPDVKMKAEILDILPEE